MKIKSFFLIFLVLFLFVVWCSDWSKQKINKEISDTKNLQQIFVLGDSLTAWYRLWYEDSYPAILEQKLKNDWYDIKVINAWESGDTSAWLKSRLDRVMDGAKTWDIAIVVIWWNDWLQWLSTKDLRQNIIDIVNTLQSIWIKTIIGWMQIPTNLWESYRISFADTYPDVANQTNSILIPFILSGVAWVADLNLSDGIHPNATWQKIIAQTVFDIIIQNQVLIKNQ